MKKAKIAFYVASSAFLIMQPLPQALAFESKCKDLPTQMELSQCAYSEMEEKNKTLNVIYKRLMAELNPEEKTRLRAAERTWIDYRDKMCEFVGLSVKGGSMEGMVISLCNSELIEMQTRILNEQLQFRE